MKRRFVKHFAIFLALAILGQNLFAQMMDARVRKVSASVQEGIFVEPEKYIQELVKELSGGSSEKRAQLKIFHDWICDNIAYDTDIFYKGRTVPDQTYQNVLLRKKAICYGYSNLLKKMCDLAGIECEVVSGWSKGAGYPGHVRMRKADHAWNKVKIGSSWQFVDVTWDAGVVDWRTYYRKYSTDYFLLEPSKFIFQHLPLEEEDQLLPKEQRRDVPRFEKEPYVPGSFFAQGLSFVNNSMPDYTHFITGKSAVEIKAPSLTTAFFANMHRSSDSASLNGMVFAERKNSVNRILYDVPDTQKYEVTIYAFQTNQKEISASSRRPVQAMQASLFEQTVIPCAKKMVELKEITQDEYNAFESAYFYVKENDDYYLYEDLFNTKLNNLILKIMDKALANMFYASEKIFSFEVVARYDYDGCLSVKPQYPSPYTAYHKTANTQVVSPLSSYLVSGSKQTISLSSTDFSNFRVYAGESNFQMKKNPKNGCWEYELTVPSKSKAQEIVVYGSKDSKNYTAIYNYKVEESEQSFLPSDAELAQEAKADPLKRAASFYAKGNKSFEDFPVAQTANFFLKSAYLTENALGKEDFSLANYYLMAGSAYSNMLDYKKALSCFERQLQIQKKNPDKNELFPAYYNCALTYSSLGEDAKARSLKSDALSLFESEEKDSLKDSAKIIARIFYRDLGIYAYNSKDFKKAYSYFVKELELCIETLGEESQGSAKSYYLAALALYNKAEYMSELEKAIELCQKALQIQKKFLKADDNELKNTEMLLSEMKDFYASQKNGAN